ncbi:hypothetical protein ACIOKD_30820 [Streptomyces sp. NPDC087844]|uniref:hypothetical protein n=1 Tax=Streptomyces sp. NPDC087844 TaxID=3365805 RepID=UPI00381851BF
MSAESGELTGTASDVDTDCNQFGPGRRTDKRPKAYAYQGLGMAASSEHSAVRDGYKVFTCLGVRLYEPVVMFNHLAFWGCSRRDVLGLYEKNFAGEYLDIGVGSGDLLDRCRMPVERP